MPNLETRLHLDMLRDSRKKIPLFKRIIDAIKYEIANPDVYGLEWGDPDKVFPLKFIKEKYVLPYVDSNHTAVEIGPGGGRWTRYLLGFKKLCVVDYHPELIQELKQNFKYPNMTFILNNGSDFPGIPLASVDYLFSFGTFVHLDVDLIAGYLKNMHSILSPGANVILQYSDKTKIMAQINSSFSDNTPDKMRNMVLSEGYKIVDEDLTTMWHSSIIHFTNDNNC